MHSGHIGGPKQKNDIPLGNKCYFYANIFKCFGPPTWPPCTYSIRTHLILILYLGIKMANFCQQVLKSIGFCMRVFTVINNVPFRDILPSITVVFKCSWKYAVSQEKLKTMVYAFFLGGGGGGKLEVLWGM